MENAQAPVNMAGTSSGPVSPAVDQAIDQKVASVMEADKQEHPAAVKEPERDLSSSFAALAKKERLIQQRIKEAEDLKKKYSHYESLISKAKDSPFEYLQAGGLTLDDLVQAELRKTVKPTAEEQVSSLEEKLKQFEEREKKKEEDQKRAQMEQAETQFRSQIKSFVGEKPDDYELIAGFDAYDTVFEVVAQVYQTKGQMLDLKKACDYVEQTLLERIQEYKRLKKIQGLFNEQPKATPETVVETKEIPTQTSFKPSVTLTNRDSVTPALELKTSEGKLVDAEESKRRVAAWLQSRLDAKRAQ